MARNFFLVFTVWAIVYLDLTWLSTLIDLEPVLLAIVSASFAWRFYHEND